MDENKALKRFGELVGYTEADLKHFQAGDPRVRQMERLGRAAAKYSIAGRGGRGPELQFEVSGGRYLYPGRGRQFHHQVLSLKTLRLRHLRSWRCRWP